MICLRHPHRFLAISLAAAVLAGAALPLDAQELSFTDSFPQPSSNGALHYNQALLSMSTIEPSKRELLSKPVWEELGRLSEDEIRQTLAVLVWDARHALAAAMTGSKRHEADFGIDYSAFGMTAPPHIHGMLQLGRLVTLAGLQAQSEGEWEKAAVYFFGSLRIARHMTRQPTLLEALTGVEILENNYYAIANWAARCPNPDLVQRAFQKMEILAGDMVNPTNTLAREASITVRRIEMLKSYFPDGPWAEMILEAIGEDAQSSDKEALKQKAIELCTERTSLSAPAFEDKAVFDSHVDRIRDLWVQCWEETSAMLTLPPVVRATRGQEIFDEYHPKLKRLGDEGLLNPAEIGSYFSIHSAELAMVRVALALAASRKDGMYPASLAEVADKFGGAMPNNPYNGQPMGYARSADGKNFTLSVNEVTAAEMVLPKIEFSSAGRSTEQK